MSKKYIILLPKCVKLFFYFIFVLILICTPVYGTNNTIYGEYAVNSLKFISYSPSWNTAKLKALYSELLNNFYGDELPFLKQITLYPNSPNGVNGYYFQDISISNNQYTAGKNAHIELYNCERYKTIEEIAPNLSHEYGHHYMTVNILRTEGKTYNEKNTKYCSLRNLSQYPVAYDYSDANYSYKWDIAEIMASDYVQLLGSPNAKRSIDYLDSAEKLILNQLGSQNATEAFNLKPQINPYLPLASQVKGLYNYMLNLSGYTSEKKELLKAPVITSIYKSYLSSIDEFQYAVYWDRAIGNGPFEYTVLMYPSNNPYAPIPLRTLKDGNTLKAFFGSAVLNLSDGTRRTFSAKYTGSYFFKVYAKDASGFIYSSAPYYYDFDKVQAQVIGPVKNNNQSSFNAIFNKKAK